MKIGYVLSGGASRCISHLGIIKALEEMFEQAEHMKDQYELYQTSPMGMRFVKQSKAYMSPEYQKEAAYIDTPFLTETKATETLLEDYQQIMLKHGGVPHWGKINSVLDGRHELIPQLYPVYKIWKKVLQRFNPNGTFDNMYVQRLGLRSAEVPELNKAALV